MVLGSLPSLIGSALEIAAVDLLLGADNAVVIALACGPLPVELRKRVLLFGLVGAIGLRFGLAGLAASVLLPLPGLRLAAAIFLLWIAVRLLRDFGETRAARPADDESPSVALPDRRFWRSVLIIVAADAAMSFDNIVAVVSISQGSATLLVFGLLLSVPALMYGSFLLTKILDEWPILMLIGAVLLGWIAGEMAVSDVLASSWIALQAPVLANLLPALCACYVFIVGHSATTSHREPR